MDPHTSASLGRLLHLALDQEQQHALIGLDPAGRVMEWAGAAMRVLGYASEEMLGQTLDVLLPEEPRARGEGQWSLASARSYVVKRSPQPSH